MENTQHFLCPPCITKCVTSSYLTCTLLKILHWKQNWFCFFNPLPLLNILLHLWLTFPTCVVVVQLSLFNSGYLLLKEQISSSPSHHLSSKHHRELDGLNNGLNWLSLDHRKTKAGTKEEASGTEKGFC